MATVSRDVYSTVDQNRLHIGIGSEYQGSVNSYNNCLTRLIAKIFSLSTNININSKSACVNSKSYLSFLKDHGVTGATLENLEDYKDFSALPSYKSVENRGLMRNHLSADKVHNLYKKLVTSLTQGDLHSASKMLGKGASVNERFWIRDYDGKIVFNAHFTKDLPHRNIRAFEATQYTPFLLAVKNNHLNFANLLESFGADAAISGQKNTFNRSITSIDRQTSLELTSRHDIVPVRSPYRRPGYIELQRPGVDVVQKQVISYEDAYSNRENISYSPGNKSLLSIPSYPQTTTERWSETEHTDRVGLI